LIEYQEALMFNKAFTRTFLYKACPRCHGDLIMDPEEADYPPQEDRVEYVCLQCGRSVAFQVAAVSRTPVAASRAA
jgi:hypothetical protein